MALRNEELEYERACNVLRTEKKMTAPFLEKLLTNDVFHKRSPKDCKELYELIAKYTEHYTCCDYMVILSGKNLFLNKMNSGIFDSMTGHFKAWRKWPTQTMITVSYTHLRAHETDS